MVARQVPNRSLSKPENVSLSQTHEVSYILCSLIKEGALRPNIPKLSVFSGRWLRERHHLSSGPMNYRPSGRLTERQTQGRGFKGHRNRLQQTQSTIWALVPPLDTIITKFSIIYGNVKSYDLLMGDFYRADQGEEETVTSFATWIEGVLSQVRDKFPNQIPLSKEQKLLKDRLFHGS